VLRSRPNSRYLPGEPPIVLGEEPVQVAPVAEPRLRRDCLQRESGVEEPLRHARQAGSHAERPEAHPHGVLKQPAELRDAEAAGRGRPIAADVPCRPGLHKLNRGKQSREVASAGMGAPTADERWLPVPHQPHQEPEHGQAGSVQPGIAPALDLPEHLVGRADGELAQLRGLGAWS